MKRWLIGLVMFVFAGCGSEDPQGPDPIQHVEAVVLIDWPLAKEDGFVADRYEVYRPTLFESDSKNPGPVATGLLSTTGTAEARFEAECGPVGQVDFYIVHVYGHFAYYEQNPENEVEDITCQMSDSFEINDCEDPVYSMQPRSWSGDRWQCQTPPAE
jgi:hypothetical protein